MLGELPFYASVHSCNRPTPMLFGSQSGNVNIATISDPLHEDCSPLLRKCLGRVFNGANGRLSGIAAEITGAAPKTVPRNTVQTVQIACTGIFVSFFISCSNTPAEPG